MHAGKRTGLGWTYSTGAAGRIITDHLAPAITGRNVMDTPGCWSAMHRAGRNLGTRGLVMQAISAVDVALWDLKARVLDVPLASLFGRSRDRVPVYGSSGFTTLTDTELAAQVDGWAAAGCTAMKIKIGQSWGTEVQRDLARLQALRELAGPGPELMVDPNGGYSTGQARRVGATLDRCGVVWFEEPVSSDDLTGLADVRTAVRCDVAAGEYAADPFDVARLCPVVDCLQLDVTRCGVTPDGCAALPSPRPTTCRSPRIAPRHCTLPWRPPCRTCGTLNGSSITPPSSHCSSTGHPWSVPGTSRSRSGLPGHGMRIRPAAAAFQEG